MSLSKPTFSKIKYKYKVFTKFYLNQKIDVKDISFFELSLAVDKLVPSKLVGNTRMKVHQIL